MGDLVPGGSKRVTGALWTEPDYARRYRHRRFLMHAPVGLLVGLMFGIFAGQRWGMPMTWFPLACGALGLYTIRAATQVESFVRTRLSRGVGRVAQSIAFLSEIAMGGLLGKALAVAMGSDGAALFGGGAATLVAYNFLVTRFFWGDWIEGTVRAMSGHAGSEHERAYAFPRKLASQGHIAEAVEAYRTISEERGGHTGPLVMAAQLLTDEQKPNAAIAMYREALEAKNVNARMASAFTEKIVELAAGDLDSPQEAADDLRDLVRRFPEADETRWAYTVLATLTGDDTLIPPEVGTSDEEE